MSRYFSFSATSTSLECGVWSEWLLKFNNSRTSREWGPLLCARSYARSRARDAEMCLPCDKLGLSEIENISK